MAKSKSLSDRSDRVYDKPTEKTTGLERREDKAPPRGKSTADKDLKGFEPSPEKVKGSSEDATFKKAYGRITKLRKGDKDHLF